MTLRREKEGVYTLYINGTTYRGVTLERVTEIIHEYEDNRSERDLVTRGGQH